MRTLFYICILSTMITPLYAKKTKPKSKVKYDQLLPLHNKKATHQLTQPEIGDEKDKQFKKMTSHHRFAEKCKRDDGKEFKEDDPGYESCVASHGQAKDKQQMRREMGLDQEVIDPNSKKDDEPKYQIDGKILQW